MSHCIKKVFYCKWYLIVSYELFREWSVFGKFFSCFVKKPIKILLIIYVKFSIYLSFFRHFLQVHLSKIFNREILLTLEFTSLEQDL